jgi:hypothetical protein
MYRASFISYYYNQQLHNIIKLYITTVFPCIIYILCNHQGVTHLLLAKVCTQQTSTVTPSTRLYMQPQGEDSHGDHGLSSTVELRFKAPPDTSYSDITIHLIGTT